MPDFNTSPRPQPSPLRLKPIGRYLVDAGLLSSDQVKVILADQQSTGMRFGDIAITRGWIKEQTLEWIVRKVIEPERRTLQQAHQEAEARVRAFAADTQSQQATLKQPYLRKDLPISKPLPSVRSSDNDVVNWVG
jgi:hypothetical protein